MGGGEEWGWREGEEWGEGKRRGGDLRIITFIYKLALAGVAGVLTVVITLASYSHNYYLPRGLGLR